MSLTKINLKWIKDLKGRPRTVKLLKENIGRKLFITDTDNDFFNMTPKEQAIKTKINKWNYIKTISFCTAKETIKIKRQPTEWENISNIHEELIKLSNKNLTIRLKNGQSTWRDISQRKQRNGHKYKKKSCSSLLIV